jgi:hypothetical protein
MARKSHSATVEALEEIQSSADRLADWIRDNLLVVLGGVGALLAVGGTVSLLGSMGEKTEREASAALYAARSEYMNAMGASASALSVPTLANPEAAAGIRDDYVAALDSISSEYHGTTVDFLSRLEAGLLVHQDGDTEAALVIYTELADQRSQGDELQGLASQRVAQVIEDLGRFAEAATRHEEAADLRGYPLRHWALADAARNHAAAGETEAAVALYDRLESEAPELRLPDAQRAQVRELQALR